MVKGAEHSQLCVAHGSHNHVHLSVDAKRMIADVMKMRLITIPVNSVFILNGYLPHYTAACLGTDSICYHICLNLHVNRMMYVLSFAYVWNLRKAGFRVGPISSALDASTVR